MLSNGPVVEQVLFSPDATGRKPADVLSPGAVLVVMSSIPAGDLPIAGRAPDREGCALC